MVFGFVVNAVGLALVAVEVSQMLGDKEPSKDSTIVQLVTGSGGDSMVSISKPTHVPTGLTEALGWQYTSHCFMD